MIKHVRITNFKSIEDVSVDLEPVTVLIGRSGTGKSNFLDALRFLRDCVKSFSSDVASRSLGDWQRIFPATTSGPISISFLVRFSGPGLSEEYEYMLTLHHRQQSGMQPPGEKLSLGNRVLYHRDAGKWIQAPPVANALAP